MDARRTARALACATLVAALAAGTITACHAQSTDPTVIVDPSSGIIDRSPMATVSTGIYVAAQAARIQATLSPQLKDSEFKSGFDAFLARLLNIFSINVSPNSYLTPLSAPNAPTTLLDFFMGDKRFATALLDRVVKDTNYGGAEVVRELIPRLGTSDTWLLSRILLSVLISGPNGIKEANRLTDLARVFTTLDSLVDQLVLNELSPFAVSDGRRYNGGASVLRSDIVQRYDAQAMLKGGAGGFGVGASLKYDMSVRREKITNAAVRLVQDAKRNFRGRKYEVGAIPSAELRNFIALYFTRLDTLDYLVTFADNRSLPQANLAADYLHQEDFGTSYGVGGGVSLKTTGGIHNTLSLVGTARRIWAVLPDKSHPNSYRGSIGMVYHDRLMPEVYEEYGAANANRAGGRTGRKRVSGQPSSESNVEVDINHWTRKFSYTYSPRDRTIPVDLHVLSFQWRTPHIHAPILNVFGGVTGNGYGFGGVGGAFAF